MKLPFWGTLFTILAVIILCRLGVWQLERLEWKQGLLENIAREYSKNAEESPLQDKDFEGVEGIKRGFIEGSFAYDHEVRIQPRLHDGKLGYHILTPFLREGSQTYILVNRGWLPIEFEQKTDEKIERPEGIVKLIGLVRIPDSGNWFTPKNDPAKGLWFQADTAEIFSAAHVKGIGPKIFYQETQNKEGLYPIADSMVVTLSNNHAQYAIFWFSMAVVLLIIFGIKFLYNPLK